MLISFIKYKIFERRVVKEIENNFFVFSFGDNGLQNAFESFLEKNSEKIPLSSLEKVKIRNYFSHIENIDGLNKVELFSYFL